MRISIRIANSLNLVKDLAPPQLRRFRTIPFQCRIKPVLIPDVKVSLHGSVADKQHCPVTLSWPGTDASEHTLASRTIQATLDPTAIFDDVIVGSPCSTARTDGSNHSTRTLPPFKHVSSMNSMWGDLSGEEFTKAMDDAYAQVVHWRPNLFKVPSGACGKQFVAELARPTSKLSP